MRSVLSLLHRIFLQLPRYAPYLLAFGVLVLAVWTLWLAFLTPSFDYGLSTPDANLWFGRLSPLIIAATFWIPGLVVLAYARPDRQASMFFLLCQGIALVLITGTQSDMGYWSGTVLFRVFLWWIGPLTIHTQMVLITSAQKRLNPAFLLTLYLSGLVLFAAYMTGQSYPGGLLFTYGRQVAYSWLALCLALSFFLMARSRFWGTEPEVRRRSGILLLSSLLGFLPLLTASLLPDVLVGNSFIPYQTTFFFLVFIPAGYSYAILRYRMVALQRYIDRSAAYSMIVLVVAVIYGICYLAFSRLLPNVERLPLLVEMSMAVILIFAVQPLYRWLRSQVNRSFYGAWYDDRSALKRISQSIGEPQQDPASVACTLCQVLEKTISLDDARIMLKNGAIVTGKAFVPCDQVPSERSGFLLKELLERTGREMGPGQDLEKLAELTPFEKLQIFGEKPRLWLLLSGSQGPLGLLVLGPRHGGDFDPDCLELLELLVRQAKTALENTALLSQVRADAGQITRLHRQLIQAREAERSGLARELHDETIQALYGVNYQISALKQRLPKDEQADLDRLRSEVSRILNEVRSICSDLRPPALDSLGIVAAAHAHLRKTRKQSGLPIRFRVEGNENQEIPDEVAMTVYRVLQESLSNAVKHAQANEIQVRMALMPDEVCLSVQDDGLGFAVPQKLELFTRRGHFGLAGIQERVELMGGQLEVITAPEQGCQIRISLPLAPFAVTTPIMNHELIRKPGEKP